jgi:hypothetical protein
VFYVSRYREWRAKMGAGTMSPKTVDVSCPHYLARVWREKAHAARLEFERWFRYHYAWREWLPARWKRLIQCETFSNFRWDSGRYVSAFGIYRAAYADDARHVGLLSWDETLRRLHRYPTPREQYRTALSHYRLHGGFDGWGCA